MKNSNYNKWLDEQLSDMKIPLEENARSNIYHNLNKQKDDRSRKNKIKHNIFRYVQRVAVIGLIGAVAVFGWGYLTDTTSEPPPLSHAGDHVYEEQESGSENQEDQEHAGVEQEDQEHTKEEQKDSGNESSNDTQDVIHIGDQKFDLRLPEGISEEEKNRMDESETPTGNVAVEISPVLEDVRFIQEKILENDSQNVIRFIQDEVFHNEYEELEIQGHYAMKNDGTLYIVTEQYAFLISSNTKSQEEMIEIATSIDMSGI